MDKFFFNCSFGRNLWPKSDWLYVRSPRWQDTSSWEQQDDGISNVIPDDLKVEDTQMGQDRTGETYLSMLLRHPVTGNCRLRCSCSFADRMAPLLVLSQELTPVHHDHLEIVMYDRGINLWHHYFKDDKPSWELVGYMDLDLHPNTRYKLEAELYHTRKGVLLTMSCEGRSFGCKIGAWPKTYYAGITACEGRNTFYDFALDSGIETPQVIIERTSD